MSKSRPVNITGVNVVFHPFFIKRQVCWCMSYEHHNLTNQECVTYVYVKIYRIYEERKFDRRISGTCRAPIVNADDLSTFT